MNGDEARDPPLVAAQTGDEDFDGNARSVLSQALRFELDPAFPVDHPLKESGELVFRARWDDATSGPCHRFRLGPSIQPLCRLVPLQNGVIESEPDDWQRRCIDERGKRLARFTKFPLEALALSDLDRHSAQERLASAVIDRKLE